MMPKLVGINYFNACRQGAEEAAKQLGDVDLQYDGPTEAKVDKQVEMINTWVTQRVNAIAVPPMTRSPSPRRSRKRATPASPSSPTTRMPTPRRRDASSS